MSRLIESSLAGKISNMLIEAERKSFKEKLTESAKRCLTEKAWTELKSGAELRKAIDECDETEIEDLRHVLDILKSCCIEAKSLCKDEYDANGFQTVIDDIEMIYDDEDLDQSSVDWELDGFFDWCDSADIFVSLRESEEVKPIEKTRDELIRDHGTDEVDLINAGKEPEERVTLKETKGFVDNIGKVADFMIDYDLYGFRNAYDGDDDAKRDALIQDIAKYRKSAAKYLYDIAKDEDSTEEQVSKANELLDIADLRQFLNESVEEPTAEDLEKEDEENKAHNKKAIEDRIGELRAAIADGVSDDEKEAMEKEIAELESHLEESSKLNEDSYEEPFFAEIEEALINAGFDVQRYTDAGMMTNNLGWVISNSEGEVQLTCAGTYLSEGTLKESANGTSLSRIEELANYLNSFVNYMKEHNVEEVKLDYSHLAGDCLSVAGEGYLPLSSDFDPDYMDDEYMQEYIAEGSLKESVSVATSDGSTVDTQDAASVQSNDGSVTVVTGDTTVIINNNPTEPALDIPQEEPVEEVPAEEIVPEEPIENEVPVEDEVIEESDDEYGIDANVDAKSLSVIKNQGITYMLQIEETSGKTTYWVCDNFNAETNEGDNADVFSDKESADKEYFDRVGLETPSEE